MMVVEIGDLTTCEAAGLFPVHATSIFTRRCYTGDAA
jgi:hypothetical protein